MKKIVAIYLAFSAVFLVMALFSHLYESRSTRFLPVISYPLRPYASPLTIIGVVLGALGIFLQTRKGNRK